MESCGGLRNTKGLMCRHATLIEVCRNKDSKLGQTGLKLDCVDVLGILLGAGFSHTPTAIGLQKAWCTSLRAQQRSHRRHATVWFAIPCTWGSPARNPNIAQVGKGEAEPKNCERNSHGLFWAHCCQMYVIPSAMLSYSAWRCLWMALV